MKKITQIKGSLSKKSILDVNETQNVKGGRRFITSSYTKYLQTVYRMIMKGYEYQTSVDDGTYCIEW